MYAVRPYYCFNSLRVEGGGAAVFSIIHTRQVTFHSTVYVCPHANTVNRVLGVN